ncbi:RNA polymerase subunit sigma-70 [Mesorhizobium sp. Root157]|uniref:RNA polymerase sigma factor n=1 Tax=Mesorhizobium sp. Root157 TaxID=1736477 RepID=UPI000701C017|nr:RNA polymerase sigma factor [Mesorhizobium sp. Root157]KQZ81949.1 RNA polymerase subunit sigma-70 [Mesorhizobium sp. Root157]
MAMILDDGGGSDAELVDRAKGGDRKAFGALVERHYDFIHRIAWRWCGNRDDADDIAQEVCIRLGRSIRDYRGMGAFTTWLYAMTLNAARDLSRKATRETAKVNAYGTHALIGSQSVDEADGYADALWQAVRRLPGKQRDAVLLVYGEELSHAAASEVMAISEATVSWHIHEAKKRLKVLMRSAGEV